MLNAAHQIKQAYEQEHMTPEEIAIDLKYEVGAVKAALIQHSSAYRKECNAEEPEKADVNFSDDEHQMACQTIVELLGAENEKVRLQAATFIRDDKKGRKDVKKLLTNNTSFNFIQFNEALKAANQKAIEV